MVKSILIGLILVSIAFGAQGARHALIVGIDEYDESYDAGTLYSCVNDALGMRQCLLEDSARWSASQITVLLNAQATKADIRAQLTSLASKAVAGDEVLFYQSSHGGWYSGTDTFLCSYNANYDDDELGADLAQFRDGVKIMIVIDACNSGGLFKSLTLSSPVKPAWNFAEHVMRHYSNSGKTRLAKTPSIGWMTASDYDETSLSGNCYSLFTGNIIYGFAHGDQSSDGVLTFQELHDYAAPRTMVQNPGQTIQTLNASVLSSFEAAKRVMFDSNVQNAVDQYSYPVHAKHGPGALWYRQTATTHDGSDAAQSGDVPHSQSSEFGIRVVGPGTLSYWWKSSSEENYDILSLVVNDVLVAGISGDVNWQQETISIGPGEHLLRWIYTKDDMGSDGSDCGWVDQISWTPELGETSSQLPNAIDDILLPITTGGTRSWARQTSTTHDGSDAARSPSLSGSEIAWFSTELIGPGDLSFWWRVSSEEGFDYVEFSINDDIKERISGDIDWEQHGYVLGAGTHTVSWCYAKDGDVDEGSDCAWVDQVVWTGDCDTDGDGLPTQWEIDNGLNYSDTSGDNGATGNPDGDAHNNLQEYITGMDPESPASCFMVTNSMPLVGADAFMVEWPAVPGRVYDVYWSTNLTQSFQPLETGIEYPRHSCTNLMNQQNAESFYKVDVRLK